MRFILSVIGGLYGLAGLGGFVPFVTLLVYGPPITRDTVLLLFWYIFPLLNSAVCFLLAYAFFRLRRWGRYVAIVYSGLWLTVTTLGLIYSRLIERPTAPWTRQASVFLVVDAFLIGVIVICSTERARRLMST